MNQPVLLDTRDTAELGSFPNVTEWLSAISYLGAKALVVLGPDPFGDPDERDVFCVYPESHAEAASSLCQSGGYGRSWRESRSPLVAWSNLTANDDTPPWNWMDRWIKNGMASMVRVELPLPMSRSFECFIFGDEEIRDRSQAADICYAMMSAWPILKEEITTSKLGISERERESLAAAADGLTAKETALRMQCTERTVTHHWTNAMRKMQTRNKVAAVQRASWLGLI